MKTIYKVVLRPERRKVEHTRFEYTLHSSKLRTDVEFEKTGRTEVSVYEVKFSDELFVRYKNMCAELARIDTALERLGHSYTAPSKPGESACWVGPYEKRSASLVTEFFLDDPIEESEEYYVEMHHGIRGPYLSGYRDDMDGTFSDRDVRLNHPKECGEYTKEIFRIAFPDAKWDERYM